MMYDVPTHKQVLYKNMNGIGTVWTEKTIISGAMGAHTVFGADIDGDGKIDVVSGSEDDDVVRV